MIGTKWRYDAEGRIQVYESFLDQKVAKLAQQILPAVLTSDALRVQLSDEDIPSSPRRIASITCDIAQAMFNEFEKREWLLHIPSPQEAEERRARAEDSFAKQIESVLPNRG